MTTPDVDESDGFFDTIAQNEVAGADQRGATATG